MATIALDGRGGVAFPMRLIDGVEEVRQRIGVRLDTWRGSWFLDDAVGVPYQSWLDRGSPPLREIEDTLTATIAGTPGVAAVRSVVTTFDPLTGQVDYAAVAFPSATLLGVDPNASFLVGAAIGTDGLLRAYVRIGGI